MNYKQYIKLNEALKNYSYQIPTDKSELLFDFYMSTFLTKTGNDNIDFVLKDMKERLYPYLKKELLSVVLFAVTAELRHLFDRNQSNIEFKKETKNFLKKYAEKLAYAQSSSSYKVFDREKDDIRRNLKDSDSRRKESYMATKKVTKNKILIVSSAMDAFFNGAWSGGFGGNMWGKICKGWLKLNNAKTLNEMTVWIDHVYDLQHNNDTVLNKVQRYSRDGGFSWINEALDLKRDIKSPYEIFDKISPSMKRIAGFVIKENEGTTLELWIKKQKDEPAAAMRSVLHEILNYINNIITKEEIESYLDDVDIDVADSRGSTALMSFSMKNDIEAVKFALDHGANINLQDNFGETAINWAAYMGQTDIVKVLLKYNADISIKNNSNKTPLDTAIEDGFDEIIELLQNHKAKKEPVNTSNKRGGYVWKTGIWEKGTWYDGTWKDGIWEKGLWKDGIWEKGTWIHGTWKKGAWYNGTWKGGTWENGEWRRGIWEYGIWKDGVWNNGTWKHGVWNNGVWKSGTWIEGWIYDPDKKGNYKDNWKWSANDDHVESPINPKEYFNKKQKDIIDILTKMFAYNNATITKSELDNYLKDVDINMQNSNGTTALIMAVDNMYTHIIKILLKYGADPDIKDNFGNTALTMAKRQTSNAITKLLLEYGKSEENTTMAIIKKVQEFFNENSSEDEIKEYFKNVDINMQDDGGNTALIWAVYNNYIEASKLLLENGADPHIKDKHGFHALSYAYHNNYPGMVHLLKQYIK